MNKDLISKMERIDEILNNEGKLKEYINEIEKTKVSYPDILESLIMSKTFNKGKIKDIYYNIIKIAACTVLAIILSQTEFIKNPEKLEKRYMNIENTYFVNSIGFIDSKVNEISQFFMKPLVIGKEEK